MAVHTRLKKKDFDRILSFYQIGDLVDFLGIDEGIENTNYLIKTSRDKYILTIFENRVKKKNLPFYLDLMFNSQKKKINCPEPISDKKGNLINNFKFKKFSIFSFLKGKSKKKWLTIDCFNVGKTLALFHEVNIMNKNKVNNDFSLDFWEKTFGKLKKKEIELIIPGAYPILQKEIKFIKTNWPKLLPRGIIHADLFPDNVFFKNNKLSGILDFYFSCHDFLMYDLAVTMNAWCFEKGIFNRKFFYNLLKGYESVRALKKNEKKYLNILLRGSSLRFLLTRLYDSIHGEENEFTKKKNPLDFFKILTFHINSQKSFSYFK